MLTDPNDGLFAPSRDGDSKSPFKIGPEIIGIVLLSVASSTGVLLLPSRWNNEDPYDREVVSLAVLECADIVSWDRLG